MLFSWRFDEIEINIFYYKELDNFQFCIMGFQFLEIENDCPNTRTCM